MRILHLFALCIGSLSSVAAAQTTQPAKPNVVVILVDDMGFSDIGCYGSEISTPNLDKLAGQGLRLREFYNTGRCCPTRASLLTGLYAHEAGVGHMTNTDMPGTSYQGFLNKNCVTIGEALRPAGYETIMVGKWHVGGGPGRLPFFRGFDHSYGTPAGGWYYPENVTQANGPFRDGKKAATQPSQLPADFYSSDAWTTAAIEYIDGAIADQKPFLLYNAFNAPHFPIQAPADLVAKYRGRYMQGWDKLRESRLQKQHALGIIDASLALTPPEDDLPKWDALSDEEKDRYDGMMASYAACVERMDYNVGRLVDHLKEKNQFDNTLILFMSDNGGNAESGINGRSDGVKKDRWGGPATTIFVGKCWATLNNTPFRKFKHFIQEGGISSPLIMSWPAKIDPKLRGQIVKGTGHLVDVMPTLLNVSGAAYPAQFEGKAIHELEGTSLLPLLSDKPLARTKPLWWEHEGNAGLREGDLKLVRLEGHDWELYDLSTDRTEIHDLAKSRPDAVKRMAAIWQATADRVGVLPWTDVQKHVK
jgi:arylsulfatase